MTKLHKMKHQFKKFTKTLSEKVRDMCLLRKINCGRKKGKVKSTLIFFGSN